MSRVTGYGNHFVELVLALLRLGSDVKVWPEYVEPPLPPEFLATLVDPWPRDIPVKIYMSNPPALRRLAEHTIGITTWETTRLPAFEFGPLPLHRRVDEVIVTAPFLLDTFAEHEVPATFVPEGVDTEFFKPKARDWGFQGIGGPLKIGMFGHMTYRKGVDLGISTFLELYRDDPQVELHIGTTNRKLPLEPFAANNVYIHEFGSRSREQVRDFFYSLHALFAPFRGEGFYLPGLEFMSTGGLLIAPSRLGTESYHSPATGIVIPSELVPVDHWGEKYHGKRASVYGMWVGYEQEALTSSLRRFVEGPSTENRRLAEAAGMQAGFLGNWDSAAQQTLNAFVKAFVGN